MSFVINNSLTFFFVHCILIVLPEHMSSPPVFNGVRVTRSLVLYVCFVDRCLSFCTFSFVDCVVFTSSIYGFWLPLWLLQTLPKLSRCFCIVFSLPFMMNNFLTFVRVISRLLVEMKTPVNFRFCIISILPFVMDDPLIFDSVVYDEQSLNLRLCIVSGWFFQMSNTLTSVSV